MKVSIMSSVFAGLLCFSGEETRLGLVSFSMVNHKILPHTTVLKQPNIHKALSKRTGSVKNTSTHPPHPQTRRDGHSQPGFSLIVSSEHSAGKDIIKSRSRHKLTQECEGLNQNQIRSYFGSLTLRTSRDDTVWDDLIPL